jgi:hypothetical protein
MNSAKINKPLLSPFEKSPFKEIKKHDKDYFRNLKLNSLYQTARSFSKTKPSQPDYDFDVMNDQIIKLKNEKAKLIISQTNLKTQYTRVDDTNKKLIKLIEESLTANCAVNFNNDSFNGENHVTNHSGNFHRLRDALLISHLKKEIAELKEVIEFKVEELENLKQSNKAIKIANLESKHLKLQEKYSILKKDYDQMKNLLDKTKEERDYYKLKVEKRLCELKNKNTKKLKIVDGTKSAMISTTSNENSYIEKNPIGHQNLDKTLENILDDKTIRSVNNSIHIGNTSNHSYLDSQEKKNFRSVDLNNQNQGKLKKFIDSVFETKNQIKVDAVDKFISVLKKNRDKKKFNKNLNMSDASTFPNANSNFGKEKIKSTGYLININMSEPQTFDAAEHYYTKPDQQEGIITRRKKSNSVKQGITTFLSLNKKEIKRTPTIDKLITEKIVQGEDFDRVMDEVFKSK